MGGPDPIRMTIPHDLRALMERELVMDEDLSRVMAHADKTGQYVIDPSTQDRTAHLRHGFVTFWVRFSVNPDGVHTVKSFYTHRMSIKGE
jgi:hypothetical protein